MKNLTLVFVAALSLAAIGCKKKGSGASADCAQAINRSMELSKAEMQKMGTDDAMMRKMADLGIQRCKEDKWPEAALKCMVDAKTMADSQGCYGKLSQEQQDKMNKAAMEMAAPPAGSGSAAAEGSAAGSAAAEGSAAGSDTGSAAGSAAPGSAGSGSSAAK